MAGALNYAGVKDVQAFLPNVPDLQQKSWLQLLDLASRGIDDYCERYFYSAGVATKYFDVAGDPSSSTIIRRLRLDNHDFFALTAIQIAQRENADPAVATDWVTLVGDGITPPSDFYLEPANQVYVGIAGDSTRRPYEAIELPATPPSTSTTFQNRFMVGKRTVSITASWGWPAIPSRISYVCTKVAIRMFKSQTTGFTGAGGSVDVGVMPVQRYLDLDDLGDLNRFKKWAA